MRIISGKYKGVTLLGFNIEGTRPTMDRVKESMFAIIQNNIKGNVLDLFAGSGALGLEALSNGADKVYFVDNNDIAIDTIKKNIDKVKVKDDTFVYNKDYKKAIKEFKENNINFDLVLLDPPYSYHILSNLLNSLYDIVNDKGMVVLEYDFDFINTSKFKLFKSKKYGKKYVTFLKK
ncbi:MAG: 16S rRNA (guanine(966)-N(2))-methyltransferase RsmD [Bacilli bacterium]|nr:16S rRNA (guanine(966)-N(2))-methyltransferase RsmD [Bacilli bacterium]